MDIYKFELLRLLNHIEYSLLNKGEPFEALSLLCKELYSIRSQVSNNEWKELVQNCCRTHPLKDLLLQEPFTRRAYQKPRGYAGDAIMMDFLYAVDGSVKSPSLENETEFGRSIHPHIMELPAAKAVRFRKRDIAKRLEHIAQSLVQPHVLSVACGHLREVGISFAAKKGLIGRYVALDHDTDSLNVVENNYRSYGVETYHASVRDILTGKAALSEFDFIYSLGLYDYLEDRVAQKVTEKLFSILKPSGTLLIANFHPGDETSAYIEAFCDWWLIYRNETQMDNLLELIPTEKIQSRKTFLHHNPSIIYLEVQKKP